MSFDQRIKKILPTIGPIEFEVQSSSNDTLDIGKVMRDLANCDRKFDAQRDRFFAIDALLQFEISVNNLWKLWHMCGEVPTAVLSIIPNSHVRKEILLKVHREYKKDIAKGVTGGDEITPVLIQKIAHLCRVMLAHKDYFTPLECASVGDDLVLSLRTMSLSISRVEEIKKLHDSTPGPFSTPEQIEQIRQLWEDSTRILAKNMHGEKDPAETLSKLAEFAPPTTEARRHLFAAARVIAEQEND